MKLACRTRYLLAMKCPDGALWFVARGASRTGPLKTADAHLAQDWESARAVREWLDSIPDEVESKDKKPRSGRAWMEGLELSAVPATIALGEPVAMGSEAAP